MDKLKIREDLVPGKYLKLALEAQKCKEVALNELLTKRQLPEVGWQDKEIEELVHYLASLDSNNFRKNVGMGERESRIACDLVARRHYNFGHGIGRSGDLLEPQPKASGSTLMSHLTNALLLNLCHSMGISSASSCVLMPMATGMTMTLCLLTLKKQRPEAKYVLWSRIDQKACFKCITAAGFTPIIIELLEDMTTDCERFREKITELGAEEILCLFSTTSCFAPRECDNLEELAKISLESGIPHLVNNAYGLQCFRLTQRVQNAMRTKGVDLVVQSADKNLMVPVGGAIVFGPNAALVESVAATYPGRATSSHTLDVFMTLLSMGRLGYLQRTNERLVQFHYLTKELRAFSLGRGEELLGTDRNNISLAVSLRKFSGCGVSKFGSMLFTRQVSGGRVVVPGVVKEIDGHTFQDWGSHRTGSRIPYLTVAAGLGITEKEIVTFMDKLQKCWNDFEKQEGKSCDPFKNPHSVV